MTKTTYTNKYDMLADLAEKHLLHIRYSSKDEKDFLFKLSSFYGTFIKTLRENNPEYIISNNNKEDNEE